MPLYVNLKELPPPPIGGLTADFIRDSVIENVRRGDADTADFVRQNWKDYRERGIWFFLFDSFDEIPAVMHAPSGSPVIRQHAEAIRQFLAGMSDCRSCLASREFKGPDALTWQKFRILALSSERQEELIQNTFLEPKQKQIVRQHLASQTTTLRNNPLFLTLLCRYVKQTSKPPVNDHDLLEQHIDFLAARDEDHTIRRYQLTPQQMLDGATQLAVLFAENTLVSLAPTLDMIKASWPVSETVGGGLENLIAALVDVKIGRSDVREARAGDRRFTFAHRRYQETLFVRFLAQRPDHLLPQQLLTDLRWREYTVTLLQTQPSATILPLLNEAAGLLPQWAKEQIHTQILPEFGGHLHYYQWESAPALDLLRLIQEGMGRRLQDVPELLSSAVESFLGPRWRDGDWFDRSMVLELGALLPQALLQGRLAVAVKEGGIDVQNAAFQQIVSIRNLSPEVTEWVQQRISDEVLAAKQRVDLLKLEALSARLPDSVGAALIFNRTRKLRWFFASGRFFDASHERGFGKAIFTFLFVMLFSQLFTWGHIFTLTAIAAGIALAAEGEWQVSIISLLVGAIGMNFFLWFDVLYLCRTLGSKINLTSAIGSLSRKFRPKVFAIPRSLLLLWTTMLAGMFFLPLILYIYGFFLGAMNSLSLTDYGLSWLVGYFITTFAAAGWLLFNIKEEKRRLMELVQNPLKKEALILSAKSLKELGVWLGYQPKIILPTEQHVRSFVRLLMCDRNDLPEMIINTPLFERPESLADHRAFVKIVESLMDERKERMKIQPIP